MKIGDRLFSIFLDASMMPMTIRDGIETLYQRHILKLDPERVMVRGKITFLTHMGDIFSPPAVKVTLDTEKLGRLNFLVRDDGRLSVGDDLIVDPQGQRILGDAVYDRCKIVCRVPAWQMENAL